MFWIVHLFALLLFWPALFVTVPLHIISSKMTPKAAAQPQPTAPPPLPGAKGEAFVPGWASIAAICGTVAFLFWYSGRPPTPAPTATVPAAPAKPAKPAKPATAEALWAAVQSNESKYAYGAAAGNAKRLLALHPTSKEARKAKELLPKLEAGMKVQVDFTVPSDPNGKFRLLHLEGPASARKIITFRQGPSGPMYTTRIYNCGTSKYRQLGASESPERMRSYSGPSPWTDLMPNSIASYVGGVACKSR